MDPRYLAILPSVIVILSIFAGVLLQAVARGRRIPYCWRCGASKVRPSHASGFTDIAAGLLLLRAFRCKGCRVRFYSLWFLKKRFSKRRLKPSPEPVLERSPAARLQTQNPA